MPTIRNARQDEARLLAEIGLRAWEGAVAGPGEADALRDNAANAFLSFTSEHWIAIDVAEKAGQVIGWAARERLDNAITDLWVEPVFQRGGIGSLLLGHVEAEIARLGYDQVTIDTQEDNQAALAFLTRHGYRVRSLTASWSAQLDRDVDVLSMVKDLVVPASPVAGPSGWFG